MNKLIARRLLKSSQTIIIEILIFAIFALIFTFPLIFSFMDKIPLGSESSSTVPIFNLWTMNWNVKWLSGFDSSYWDAPLFFPAQGTFAFSDPQPLTGFLAAAFWRISPAFAYNFLLILFMTLNGFSVYKFVKESSSDFYPALFAGLISQALPFLSNERGVIQLQPIFGLIWAVHSMIKLFISPKWKYGIALGLSVAITFLTSEYYGLILLVLLTPLGLLAFFRWRSKVQWLSLTLAVTLTLILSGAFLISQQQILEEYNFSRSTLTVINNSAKLKDYFSPPWSILANRIIPGETSSKGLYPGISLTVLGISAFFLPTKDPHHKKWKYYLGITTLVALIFSFGFNLKIGDLSPYQFFYDQLPGFKHLRSPFRFGFWVQISFAILAYHTLKYFWVRNRLLTLLLLGITLVEFFPTASNVALVPRQIRNLDIQGSAVIIPYVSGRSAKEFNSTANWMFQFIESDLLLLNGYSGYFPIEDRTLRDSLSNFPDRPSLAKLTALQIDYLILDMSKLNQETIIEVLILEENRQLVFVRNVQEFKIYSFPTSP